jgi:hypothetical protein
LALLFLVGHNYAMFIHRIQVDRVLGPVGVFPLVS